MKAYKRCIVPKCKNTSVKTPNKRFIIMPANEKTRIMWQKAMGTTRIYFAKNTFVCEDHFNLKEDLENYLYIKLMGSTKMKLKPGVVPHIFECQGNPSVEGASKSPPIKRQSKQLTSTLLTTEDTTSSSNIVKEIAHIQSEPKTDLFLETTITNLNQNNKYIQVNLTPSIKSKGIQCCISKEDNIKRAKRNASSSLTDITSKKKPRWSKKLFKSSSISTSDSSSFGPSSSGSSVSEYTVSSIWDDKLYAQKKAVSLIERNPKLYLGIPCSSMFIIDMLCTKCEVPRLDIFITLKKLRVNLSYQILADDFGVSPSVICTKIQNVLPKLKVYLAPFVQWKTLEQVKKHLPIPFRRRYKNMQCIIDCFEVSIQKPTDPILQSFTWSEYKGCNTIKFLIGCTPDGLISFISKGFGGRTTDKMIVEESGFLKLLESNAQIMADRGFKHLEERLATLNCKLIRPPTVSANKKSSTCEVKEAKRIASLRIHVERVISRVREFAILQPHSCVHSSFIKYLDLATEIVCGLINIQNYLVQ